jgi:glycosyltransferase involved in cell wall biosynthesis
LSEKLPAAHRLWRCLPAGWRRAGLGAAARALSPRKAAAPAHSAGVVVAGEIAAPTGMGEAARAWGDGIAALGLPTRQVALTIGGRAPALPMPGAALVLAVNAPSIPLVLARAGRSYLAGRRVIGAWAWELPVAPAGWARAAAQVHEVWACSAFAAAALAPLFPRVTAVPFPLALLARPAPAPDRAGFGLPEHAVVTVMVFSLGSSFSRKNPLAAIRAFKTAFGDDPSQLLVVKYSGAAAYPAHAARIEALAGGNVLTMSGSWPQARVQALIASADMVISLHRAEGFGFVLAEAMLLGIPVIATGWSGNMDFMDAQSAALVDAELIPVADEAGLYRDLPAARWAAPDEAQAAAHLARLGADRAARVALGQRGRAFAARALDGASLAAALRAAGIDGA